MKFIFPQNYNFKNKILGIIDYSTAFLNLVWDILVFVISNIFFSDWTLKIFILIIFCFPLLLFSFVVFSYLISFFTKPKLYLYKK